MHPHAVSGELDMVLQCSTKYILRCIRSRCLAIPTCQLHIPRLAPRRDQPTVFNRQVLLPDRDIPKTRRRNGVSRASPSIRGAMRSLTSFPLRGHARKGASPAKPRSAWWHTLATGVCKIASARSRSLSHHHCASHPGRGRFALVGLAAVAATARCFVGRTSLRGARCCGPPRRPWPQRPVVGDVLGPGIALPRAQLIF